VKKKKNRRPMLPVNTRIRMSDRDYIVGEHGEWHRVQKQTPRRVKMK
jgi:hypothetical protein